MKALALLLPLSILLLSFESTPGSPDTDVDPDGIADSDTITKLSQIGQKKNAIFKAPNGKFYRVSAHAAGDDFGEVAAESVSATKAFAKKAETNPPCQSDVFDGTDRKASKIEIDKAQLEHFNALNNLIKTLPSDAAMGKNYSPPIDKSATSKRVKEEKRNVYVKKAWIYTFKREGDEDYHVIIGSTANKSTATFFNIEVSGLPAASSQSYARMKKVRKRFEDFFGLSGSCQSGYANSFIDSPVEIEVTGSLFFDKLHYDGKASIGTGVAKPKSYWEIHPVSDITFK